MDSEKDHKTWRVKITSKTLATFLNLIPKMMHHFLSSSVYLQNHIGKKIHGYLTRENMSSFYLRATHLWSLLFLITDCMGRMFRCLGLRIFRTWMRLWVGWWRSSSKLVTMTTPSSCSSLTMDPGRGLEIMEKVQVIL